MTQLNSRYLNITVDIPQTNSLMNGKRERERERERGGGGERDH